MDVALVNGCGTNTQKLNPKATATFCLASGSFSAKMVRMFLESNPEGACYRCAWASCQCCRRVCWWPRIGLCEAHLDGLILVMYLGKLSRVWMSSWHRGQEGSLGGRGECAKFCVGEEHHGPENASGPVMLERPRWFRSRPVEGGFRARAPRMLGGTGQ